ncbi:MAG TPA: terminase family protein [Verrucomicrobiae bacterium]|nr:terminase family protein [Verrucomicrobiae bacterium]
MKRNTKHEAGAALKKGVAKEGSQPKAMAGAPANLSARGADTTPSEKGRKTAGPRADAFIWAENALDKIGTADRAKAAQSPGFTISPRDLLLPYQRQYADDGSRFKLGLWARQVGKDFTSGEEGIRDIYQHEIDKDKTGWLIAAPSERQSLESLGKWKEWTEAYKLAIEDIVEEREGKSSEALLKSATIVFPNGSRAMAVPGKPETVRGFSMNVLATEFDFFEKPDETLRAIMPSITNPLRGGPKKFRLVSTPNGAGRRFHELCKQAVPFGSPDWQQARKENRKGFWSLHKVTIWDAVNAGLPIDPEEIRLALNDPEGWAQEYECQFLDTAAVLLPYEVIALCESPEATEVLPPEYWQTSSPFPVDLGIDFGRKKDLTCSWAAEKVADLQITKEVLCLERMSSPEQVNALRPRIRKARRVCFDYTGPGIGMGDYLVQEFGEWNPEQNKFGKIELITMTNPMKVELFSKLRMAYDQRAWRIPMSRAIREDLHSIYRVVTPNGNVTYRAPHTEDGHADRANAQALCTRAGSEAVWCGVIIVPSGRRSQVLADKRERSVAG